MASKRKCSVHSARSKPHHSLQILRNGVRDRQGELQCVSINPQCHQCEGLIPNLTPSFVLVRKQNRSQGWRLVWKHVLTPGTFREPGLNSVTNENEFRTHYRNLIWSNPNIVSVLAMHLHWRIVRYTLMGYPESMPFRQRCQCVPRKFLRRIDE